MKEWFYLKKEILQIQIIIRIPAITTTSQGTIIAVADYRHDGYGDIGLNTGVDFAIKISHDGGNTWSDKTIITPENGLGISDPAIVHNSDTGRTFSFWIPNDKFITTKPTSEKSDFLCIPQMMVEKLGIKVKVWKI